MVMVWGSHGNGVGVTCGGLMMMMWGLMMMMWGLMVMMWGSHGDGDRMETMVV